MSYILNALRKAEKERQQKQEQTLGAQLQDHKTSTARGLMPWLLLLLAINLCVLAYVMLREEGQTQGGNQQPVAQAAPPVAEFAKKSSTAPESAEPEVSREQSQVAEIEASPRKNTVSAASEPKLGMDESVKTEAEMQQTVIPEENLEFESSQPLVSAASEKPKQAVDVPADIAVATGENSEKLSGDGESKRTAEPVKQETTQKIVHAESEMSQQNKPGLPWLHEMPAAFRRQVPELDINVYVYDEQPENRFIMIAMKKFKVGQEISSGMLLQEIQSDGIVVQYQGKRFKIKRA